jgi:Tol biopolymer transport system component
LYTVRPDGTGVRKIPLLTRSNTFLQNPDWSPDCTKIVFSLATSNGPGTFQMGIYTANANGTNIQRVTTPEIFDRYADWGPHPLTT